MSKYECGDPDKVARYRRKRRKIMEANCEKGSTFTITYGGGCSDGDSSCEANDCRMSWS